MPPHCWETCAGRRDALSRAGEASNGQVAADSGLSAWSRPRPRQALFILSVGVQCGGPDAALRAAEMADQTWADGDPWVAATWAQVRLGAGVAHIIKGDLGAAKGELAPVLTLDPALRIATVVAYTAEMDRRLRQQRFRHDPIATQMREQIKAFNSGFLSGPPKGDARRRLPSQMADRLHGRAEPNPGQGTLYWHILLGNPPQVRELASIARERLAGFSGLHFTPKRWLHVTTLAVGLVEEFTEADIGNMVGRARGFLGGIPPEGSSLARSATIPKRLPSG